MKSRYLKNLHTDTLSPIIKCMFLIIHNSEDLIIAKVAWDWRSLSRRSNYISVCVCVQIVTAGSFTIANERNPSRKLVSVTYQT